MDPATTTQPTPVSVGAPGAPPADTRPAPPPPEPEPHDEPGYGHGV